ncbi:MULTISPECIES: winged helix-turn-helix transcriptional regulator [Aliiglaciecola]|uniref:winged helix-turn-helix transcriptional regulator n=1 Tax=Aliiglaciecola TaxID=1406885 RepID=UPI001C098295|nr:MULTISPECIES: helix-turn-helix domain-containing protein [Aliiglaciecola]MBU2876885.1 helix-turn-helix transcriptional regulator [Aliiglaciecola lipolytica]MDO6713197.1 helix-turn-helix domain-containing protein [Aliiglaciecola sp. 2_MG-2023]MDO6754317.1 helix-turn-helix domain-containing protein [Aliiglaciecola sp. 1_MG-2023]
MRWDDINTQTCSIAKASSVFGDRWTLLIVRQLFLGLRRFSDIQKSLGITKHRLSDRLSRLIEEDLVYKHLYDENYNRFEYRLTEKGLDLYPVLITLSQWGDKWMCDADGVPVEYVHTECGQVANPKLSCSCCGKPLNLGNLTLRVGPGVTAKCARGDINDKDKMLYGRMMSATDSSE